MAPNIKIELLALSYKILEENKVQTLRQDKADYSELLRLLAQHRALEVSQGCPPTFEALTLHLRDLNHRLQHYQLTGEFYSSISVTACNDAVH